MGRSSERQRTSCAPALLSNTVTDLHLWISSGWFENIFHHCLFFLHVYRFAPTRLPCASRTYARPPFLRSFFSNRSFPVRLPTYHPPLLSSPSPCQNSRVLFPILRSFETSIRLCKTNHLDREHYHFCERAGRLLVCSSPRNKFQSPVLLLHNLFDLFLCASF